MAAVVHEKVFHRLLVGDGCFHGNGGEIGHERGDCVGGEERADVFGVQLVACEL